MGRSCECGSVFSPVLPGRFAGCRRLTVPTNAAVSGRLVSKRGTFLVGLLSVLSLTALLHAQSPAPGGVGPAVSDRLPIGARTLGLPPPIARGRAPLPPETALDALADGALAEGLREHGPSWLGPTRQLPPGVEIAPGPDRPVSGGGRWSRVGGQRVWRATLRSRGARAVRVRLASFATSGRIYLYPPGSGAPHAGPYTGRGPQADGDFWSDLVLGDSVTIEYVEGSGDRRVDRPPFRVRSVAHIVSMPGLRGKPATPGTGAGGFLPPRRSIAGCDLDVSCYAAWQDRDRPSSVHLLVTTPERTVQCTGSTVSTRYRTDRHLLLLTAGHCVATEDEAANAVFTWNLQTLACSAQSRLPDRLVTTAGSQLLASRNDSAGDFALLRLSAAQVREVTGWTSLGWDPDPAPDETSVVTVSHPRGMPRRVAFGRVVRTDWSGLRAGTFTGMRWSSGSAASGSSGAAVQRREDGRLIGIVVGGARNVGPCDPGHRAALLQFEAIYAETRTFFESEAAVEGLVRQQAHRFEIPLGTGGDTLTIVRAADGTYWLGADPVWDGMLIRLPDGRKFRLSQGEGGAWEAVLVERFVTVRLPDGEALVVRDTADGHYWLGDLSVAVGTGLTHARFGTFRLASGGHPDEWQFEAVPFGIPLLPLGLRSSTVAGTGLHGYSGDGDLAVAAQLANPSGVAMDLEGNIYIADTDNHRIRKVDREGVISTFAGTGEAGFFGDGRPASEARLRHPTGLAMGPAGDLFVADTGNHRVRAIQPSGLIRTVAGGGDDGFSGDGSSATEAMLSEPAAVAVDAAGTVLIADSANHRIRRVASGVIETVAGTGLRGFGGDGGPAGRAALRFPKGISFDGAGNIFVADTGNNRVRRIAADGRISTVMGTGARGREGDGGPAVSARLTVPRGVSVGLDGALRVADTGNDILRLVAPNGLAATVTGIGPGGPGVSGSPARDVRLKNPFQVEARPNGSVVIADARHHRVLALEPAWTPVPRESMPSPVRVALPQPGSVLTLWALDGSRHFASGAEVTSGDVIAGWPFRRGAGSAWDGVAYRLADRPGRGWTAEPVVLDHWAAARNGQILPGPGVVDTVFRLGLLYQTERDMRELPAPYRRLLLWLRGSETHEAPDGTSELVALLRARAETGDPSAQSALGDLYRRYDRFGTDVDQRLAEALRWYGMSAARGHPGGQYGLGVMHDQGFGVEKNAAEGARWYRMAAKQGHALAQRNLGRLYESGGGVAEDSETAAYWYARAARRGEPWAQIWLAWLYLPESGADETGAEGVRWMRRAATRGYAGGQDGLGWIYEHGVGVGADPAEAARWYRRSAAQGSGYGQWRLGHALASGEGVARDDVAALVWLSLAVRNGERRATISRESLRHGLTAEEVRQIDALVARCSDTEYADCP